MVSYFSLRRVACLCHISFFLFITFLCCFSFTVILLAVSLGGVVRTHLHLLFSLGFSSPRYYPHHHRLLLFLFPFLLLLLCPWSSSSSTSSFSSFSFIFFLGRSHWLSTLTRWRMQAWALKKKPRRTLRSESSLLHSPHRSALICFSFVHVPLLLDESLFFLSDLLLCITFPFSSLQEDLIRLSIGMEGVTDIIASLKHALDHFTLGHDHCTSCWLSICPSLLFPVDHYQPNSRSAKLAYSDPAKWTSFVCSFSILLCCSLSSLFES